MDLWAYQNDVNIRFTQPGRPTDNACIESFNGTLRAECLDTHWFGTMEEAKETIEAWRRKYNQRPPTRAAGERTPNELAHEIAASRDLPDLKTAENSAQIWYKYRPVHKWMLSSLGTQNPGHVGCVRLRICTICPSSP